MLNPRLSTLAQGTAGVIGITSKDCLWPRKDSESSFNRTLADVLHVRILCVPSHATDVIVILMMMVAWKLSDPGIGESGGHPRPHMHPM
jgi:hypothetical protein